MLIRQEPELMYRMAASINLNIDELLIAIGGGIPS
jgi:hypothetical protein